MVYIIYIDRSMYERWQKGGQDTLIRQTTYEMYMEIT